jgi:hypothetical protein
MQKETHNINVSLVEGFTQGALQARLYPDGTMCTSPFKWNCGTSLQAN